MKPSIKSLLKEFPELTKEQAIELRTAMDNNKAMELANKLIGGFGVEYQPKGNNAKSPSFAYVNTGDTYNTTIVRINGNYRITCWGDIVEKGNYN